MLIPLTAIHGFNRTVTITPASRPPLEGPAFGGRMKKETQREKLEALLNYAFACRTVANNLEDEGRKVDGKMQWEEMYKNLLLTFELRRKSKP